MTDTEPSDTGRFRVSLEELEASAHVPVDQQVTEVPSTTPGRAPGDDDLSRQQRDALRAGA